MRQARSVVQAQMMRWPPSPRSRGGEGDVDEHRGPFGTEGVEEGVHGGGGAARRGPCPCRRSAVPQNACMPGACGRCGPRRVAYLDRARRFVEGSGCAGELAALTAADITSAVERDCAGVSAGSVQYFVAALRSFPRLCFVEGLVGINLSAAAAAVTGRRRSSLPMGISHADATALLGSCDRRRSDGRRDCSRAPARTRHVPPGPAGYTFVTGIGEDVPGVVEL